MDVMAHTTREAESGGPRPVVRPSDAAAARRPDASMTLLREVMERPLDPGYAAAARRRERAGRPSPAAVAVTVVVAVLCGAVATSAVVELRRPQPEALQTRARIEEEIRSRSAAVAARDRENRRLREQIAQAQSRALASDGGDALAERGRLLALVSSESPAVGPGLEISMNDAPRPSDPAAGVDPRENPQADEGRVLDRDLQLVVNGLWSAGAEAVAINGQRLTALSAIRSAGLAILVDFRPLVPPYLIEAVGSPSELQTGFAADMAGPYLQSLRDNWGVQASIAVKERLELPGASAVTLRSATVPRPSAPPTASPTSPGSSPTAVPSGTGSATPGPTSSGTPSLDSTRQEVSP